MRMFRMGWRTVKDVKCGGRGQIGSTVLTQYLPGGTEEIHEKPRPK